MNVTVKPLGLWCIDSPIPSPLRGLVTAISSMSFLAGMVGGTIECIMIMATHDNMYLPPSLPIACNEIHFCKTDPTNDRPLYRLFVQGVVTAFMGVYLQGNSDLLKFVTTQTLMPLPLGLLEYDLNC